MKAESRFLESEQAACEGHATITHAAVFVVARIYMRITRVKGLGYEDCWIYRASLLETEQSRRATSAVREKQSATRMSPNAITVEHTIGSVYIWQTKRTI